MARGADGQVISWEVLTLGHWRIRHSAQVNKGPSELPVTISFGCLRARGCDSGTPRCVIGDLAGYFGPNSSWMIGSGLG